jgi:uncharacterized OB-fold protein
MEASGEAGGRLMWGTCPECGKDDYLTQLLCYACGVSLGYVEPEIED